MTTYPIATDSQADFQADAAGNRSDHASTLGRVTRIWENVLHHGAVGDGVTDDTAAFEAATDAAGDGGIIYAPGTFALKDFTPQHQITIKGAGMRVPTRGSGGTCLVAASGATWAVQMLGWYAPCLEDLLIDGNNRASSGVLFAPGSPGGTTSQGPYMKRVWMYRCDVGAKFDAGSGTQADKNTLEACRSDECNTGLWLNTPNSQFTQLRNVSLGADLAVRMSGGGLTWIGGGWTNGSATGTCTGILFDGASCEQVTLIDVISESSQAGVTGMVDIDGENFWPILGVHLQQCILQGFGTDPISIIMGAGQLPILTADHSAFVSDIVARTGSNASFSDSHCYFGYSGTASAWRPETGSFARRLSTAPRVDPGTGPIQYNTVTQYGGTDGTDLLWEFDGTDLTLSGRLIVPEDGTAFVRGYPIVVASDTFNRANGPSLGTATLGGTWTVEPPVTGPQAAFEITSSKAAYTPGADIGFAYLAVGITDYTIEADVTLSSGTSGAGLMFRGDGTHHAYVELVYVSSSDHGILLHLDGSVPTGPTISLTPGNTYHLSVTVNGAVITASVDDTEYIAYTLSTAEQVNYMQGTRAGLSAVASAGEEDGGSRWDNWKVTGLPARVTADGYLFAKDGIAVGNSAAATTLGSVAKKMEVFGPAGNSLGFVPLYDAIT